MDTQLITAKWTLGYLAPEELPDVATQALAEGYDGTCLRRLAGLVRPTRTEVGDLFDRALAEIGAGPMPLDLAGRVWARHVAESILRGGISPKDGRIALFYLFWELDEPDWLSDLLPARDDPDLILRRAKALVEELPRPLDP